MFLRTAILTLVIFSPLILSGCSNHEILPDTGPDIQQVYLRHIGGQIGRSYPEDTKKKAKKNGDQVDAKGVRYRPVHDGEADLVDYTRTAANEIDQLFPVLPNPQLVIYVYPHFTGKGRPVPGYSTVTRMYDRVEYAMPGEWIADHPDSVGGNLNQHGSTSNSTAVRETR